MRRATTTTATGRRATTTGRKRDTAAKKCGAGGEKKTAAARVEPDLGPEKRPPHAKSTRAGGAGGEKKSGGQVVATIAAAAAGVGVHQRTLKEWLSRGCPGRAGHYDVVAIAAWREATLAPARSIDEAGGERGEWETRKSRAAALKAELELSQLHGRLIEVDTAARIVGRHIAEVKSHLEQLPDFALAVVRLPAAQKKTLRERLAAKVRELCATFQETLKELAVREEQDAEGA